MTVSEPHWADEDTPAELAAAADEMLAEILTRTSIRTEIDEYGFSCDAWKAAVEAGWFQVALTEDHDGLGLGLSGLAGIAQAVGRHLLPGPITDHAVVLPMLIPDASEPARERLNTAINGAAITVLVDGAAGSADGSALPQLLDGRLTGAVEFVRFGTHADELLVAAVGERQEPTVALISASADGVTVTSQPSFDPIIRYATVGLDNVAVDHVVLVPGTQTAVKLAELRAAVRLFTAAETAGVARRLLDTSVEFALERHQFGKPIGSFQAIKHLLADMAAATLMLEIASADALQRAVDHSLLESLSWQSKALAAWVGRQVGEGALQVHGGVAFTIEHDVHRGFQHALALQGIDGDERELARKLGWALLRGELEPWA
ncbi:acyl-CoA dehydrogenase family protein [Mycobacterium vicinigordonae]|uniref:Acyl-CoA/acyl-ACP dehydrogenase n=1 Tax=Mycobacterium vicinigordonae TaxID=1719132 RepID=A0A7D6HWK6_9MYCO|nr:acyl-CoA dehydrogenase family protein [Mycobacterium vicinigordonae]QLL06235.1 acyl-CoA/acyl-ACP dehydrogenase [Mycobacterium vicinigordonae]